MIGHISPTKGARRVLSERISTVKIVGLAAVPHGLGFVGFRVKVLRVWCLGFAHLLPVLGI